MKKERFEKRVQLSVEIYKTTSVGKRSDEDG